MEMWMVGLGLAAILAVAARDVGRPGAASGAGLLCLRLVGGAGLGLMAALALQDGRGWAALVAAAAAAPLLAGLVRSRAATAARGVPMTARAVETPAGAERRAA